MKIKDMMTTDPEITDPDATIEQAARAMADADVGSLPVLRAGKVLGVLTDRDIVVRVVAEGLPTDSTTVEQVMTSDVVHCSEEDELEGAAEVMAANQVRRLVVLDAAGGFAGVVSLADVALHSAETAEDVLEEVSRPSDELSQGVFTGGPALANHNGGDSSVVTLMKDELAAIERYKEVLQTIHSGKAGDELRRIENEHEEAAKSLKERLFKMGMDAPRDSDIEGVWAGIQKKTPELFDEKTSIKLLKKGEEREIEDYERALRDEALDSNLKSLIASSLLPKTRAHVPALDRFLREGPVS